MIGESLSHYRILRNLGDGGMGVVYEAEDLNLIDDPPTAVRTFPRPSRRGLGS